MILGWVGAVVLVVLALSLCSSFVRIIRDERRAQVRRSPVRSQSTTSRFQRLFRIMVEPIIGR